MSFLPVELAEMLSTVQRPGDFYSTGTLDIFMPGLAVAGVGPLALPLLPVQAQQLIAVAEQAPYGKGEPPWLTRRCGAPGKSVRSTCRLPGGTGSRRWRTS